MCFISKLIYTVSKNFKFLLTVSKNSVIVKIIFMFSVLLMSIVIQIIEMNDCLSISTTIILIPLVIYINKINMFKKYPKVYNSCIYMLTLCEINKVIDHTNYIGTFFRIVTAISIIYSFYQSLVVINKRLERH